jgi:hypothetical protein
MDPSNENEVLENVLFCASFAIISDIRGLSYPSQDTESLHANFCMELSRQMNQEKSTKVYNSGEYEQDIKYLFEV